jgi:DNA repair protein RecN (Recombination protein N)
MLVSLSIRNVVLIEQLVIEFREGLCALTGETGAGKSILLDALGLALGNRSEAGLVRKGADQAIVTAEFSLPVEHPVFRLLNEQGLSVENPLLLRRVINADGRSRAFINDQPVSIGMLKSAGEMLVEIHGQFETQGLLNPATHRGLLDDYAQIDNQLPKFWEAWQAAKDELEKARLESEKARTDEEYLRQAIEDLDELSPKEDEEEYLTNLRDRLMRREQIIENLNAAHAALNDAGNSANTAARALGRTGDETSDIVETVDGISIEIGEALSRIEALSADLEECEHNLQTIDDRLFALKGQARKHDCTIAGLPSVREELARRLNLIERSDDILASLMKQTDAARNSYIREAEKVSELRTKAANKLDGLVARELPPLKLDKSRFVTSLERKGENDWGPEGIDRVRFLVSTNPGTEPGPLNKIASGGEMARFMLALKVIMAEVGSAQTLIFDEVDSGIGGGTADAVGERLSRLASSKQILVVTHSPQVAARARHHWIVLKGGQDNITTTVVHLEESPSRREEIARMLAGSTITDEARAAAGKLLEAG